MYKQCSEKSCPVNPNKKADMYHRAKQKNVSKKLKKNMKIEN